MIYIEEIYGGSFYGQGETNSFNYAVGDLIELQWNGQKKKFTTVKMSNG